jgi:hypothetical protein
MSVTTVLGALFDVAIVIKDTVVTVKSNKRQCNTLLQRIENLLPHLRGNLLNVNRC